MSGPPNFFASFEAEKFGGADTWTYQAHQRSVTRVIVDLLIRRSFRAVDSAVVSVRDRNDESDDIA